MEWVGRFRIDLLNGRGWPAPPAEIEVRRETVHLRHQLVEMSVVSRRLFAEWLAGPSDAMDSAAVGPAGAASRPVIRTSIGTSVGAADHAVTGAAAAPVVAPVAGSLLARPMVAGSVAWAWERGALMLTVGSARYRLTDDSRRQVVLLV
ncbi:hypothetical protein LWF15_26925 [Kineosporia rhizophila]|uniref:hypothetical protein n=1 Tax=Kineosporia TaxID=49184 RepID=UPI001E54868B|nr:MULTISPECIES: hypothetical protein [Kineosporia]MCE0539140.1 hypothetical protein [Kineosporia rhizophila]GLY18098.1 hypothetical protein Kisp01_51120 [Kineosporia sp. NBRC 101677]